jgi:uncharacterized protein
VSAPPPRGRGVPAERAEPRCPICSRPVEPACGTRPFCSLRCKMVDLGRWFDESYRVPGEDAVSLEGFEGEERDPESDG